MSTEPPSPTPGPSVRVLLLTGLVVVLIALGAGALLVVVGSDRSSTAGATDAAPVSLDRQLAQAARPDRGVPTPTVDRFDADRALRLVRMQLRAGPRPSGSRALERLRPRLRERLPRGAAERVDGHPGLFNLVGRIPGRRPAIVLAAHYDTQIDPPGFVGANDGAAGPAVVIEAARALAARPRPARAREVRFVLFDGEELPADGRPERFGDDGLRGSRAYARTHARDLGAVVVADYVAGRGLRLPREPQSDRALWGRIRTAAARVGVAPVVAGTGKTSIVDDHVPFLDAGVPAVTLIDWDYPQKNTAADTLDRLSAGAIDATGETLVAWLDAERRR
ncbi:MAG: M28 family peptidase [Patulibacter sp.]|nr:M28 family peptidase [Patulibacter sp.]